MNLVKTYFLQRDYFSQSQVQPMKVLIVHFINLLLRLQVGLGTPSSVEHPSKQTPECHKSPCAPTRLHILFNLVPKNLLFYALFDKFPV